MKNPTVREIADACGVHASTVSRALANSSRIPVETRERILKEAKKLGWKPNPLASAYMTHFRSTRMPQYQASMAFVIAAQWARSFDELPEYQRKVLAGARERAADFGFVIDTIWMRELGWDPGRLSRVLRSRGVLGVLMHGGYMHTLDYTNFRWDQFALATWGHSLRFPIHRAAFNSAHGLRMALKRLRQKGYRRIAMIMPEQQHQLADYGYLSAFYFEMNHHQDLQEWLRAFTFAGTDANYSDAVREWIEKNEPEVIIGDQLVLEVLHNMRWKIPGDVAFTTLFWSQAWSEIAGLDQRPELIGANVMDLLGNKIVQNERGIPDSPKLVLSTGTWMDGESVPNKGPMMMPDFRDPLDFEELG